MRPVWAADDFVRRIGDHTGAATKDQSKMKAAAAPPRTMCFSALAHNRNALSDGMQVVESNFVHLGGFGVVAALIDAPAALTPSALARTSSCSLVSASAFFRIAFASTAN
jgi:protein-S-isoprenylcysteine O-methyltransferase Ste14